MIGCDPGLKKCASLTPKKNILLLRRLSLQPIVFELFDTPRCKMVGRHWTYQKWDNGFQGKKGPCADGSRGHSRAEILFSDPDGGKCQRTPNEVCTSMALI